MNLWPTADIVIVKEIVRENRKKGEILIPGTTTYPTYEAEVIAVGPGSFGSQGQRLPIDILPGEIVVVNRMNPATSIIEDGQIYIMVHAAAILAVRKPSETK